MKGKQNKTSQIKLVGPHIGSMGKEKLAFMEKRCSGMAWELRTLNSDLNKSLIQFLSVKLNSL